MKYFKYFILGIFRLIVLFIIFPFVLIWIIIDLIMQLGGGDADIPKGNILRNIFDWCFDD